MSNHHDQTAGFGDEDRKRARRGTTLSLVGGVILAGVRALGFFLRAIFGGEMWGLYAIAWSLVELLAFFLLGGFSDAVVIFAARVLHREGGQQSSGATGQATGTWDDEGSTEKQYRALATILTVPFIASLGVAASTHFFADDLYRLFWSQHDPLLISLLRTLAWSLPLLVLVQIPAEATRATLRFGAAIGIVQVAFPVLSLLCAAALYFALERSILAVAQGTIVALVLCLPASFFAYTRHFDGARTLKYVAELRWDREALSFAVPQSLNMMLNQGLVRLDSLMLSFFGVSANSIGIYSLVGDVTQIVRLAKMAFSSVFSPLVAKYRAQGNKRGVVEALDDIARKTSSLGVVLLLVTMSLWPLFIFSHGESWEGSRLFPWLLCAGPLMSCFFGLLGNTLLMFGHSRLLLINAVVTGLLNVVLNAVMIPAWGLFGAALATAIANVAISLLQLYELRQLEGITTDFAYYRRTLIAAFFPTIGVLWLTGWIFPITGNVLGYSPWLVRGTLAACALGIYMGLQWALPGRRPWGGPERRPRRSL